MAKITSPDLIEVGTELTLDTAASTFTLNVAGDLVAKDGVTLQALYSKFVDLWTTSAYNKFEFPMYTIDAKSGQYQFGTDGATFSGWKPSNDATRQMLRDGGWSEYSSAGALNRQYVGIVSLGEVSAAAQLYYQKETGGAAANFTFTDEVNEGIQVFGDASNGNFDNRTYFKSYVREYGKKYDDSILGDTGQTSTGAYTVNMLLSNEDDLKIQAADGAMTTAPYDGITVTYYGTDQTRTIGGVSRTFRVIIDGNGATAEKIYTKVQYLLRQATDIDSGAGTVIGKTAAALLNFVGDTTLITTTGVYIDDYDADDVNRLVFTDQSGVQRTEPFTATVNFKFNSFLVTGGTGYYRAYFSDLAGAADYGAAGAITVQDASGADIQGTISSESILFTFAYDSNTQGGRTAETDAAVTVVAGNAGSAKPVVTTYTITRATGQNITLTAEQDRAYIA
jgi:hypothetical protein